MSYRGDFALGSTFDLKFTTRKFSTGAPFTLAGSPVISAYPDNSTTQLTAGITLSVDFDSVTGLNNVRVVATGGNGYAAGSNYDLVITTGTVDSVSVVGETIGSFSLEARSAVRPTVAGRTLDISTGGEAGLDWANVGSPTTTQGLSGTTIGATTIIETMVLRANVAQAGAAGNITLDASASATDDLYKGTVVSVIAGTGAGQSRRVTGYVGSTKVASVSPNWATNPASGSTFALIADGDAQVVAAGVNLTAIPWNAAWDTEVQSEVQDAIEVNQLDHFIQVADPGGVVANNSFLAKLTSKSATAAFSSYDNTTDALEAVRDKEADIETDTQDIQGRLPAALVSGRIDSSVGAMAADVVTASAIATDAIGSAEFSQAAADKVWSSTTRTLSAFSTALAVSVWDVLASAVATASSIGLQIKTNLDGTVSSRASQTTADAIEADTQDLQSRTPAALVGGRTDANVGAISADSTAADNLEAEYDGTGYLGDYVRIATAQAGGISSITLDASASATNDLYLGMTVTIVGGTGAAQSRVITNYVGSTKVATTFPTWNTNPNSSSVFAIRSSGPSVLAGYFDRPDAVPLVNIVESLGNGFPSVNAEYISSDATAATNLEAALDGTGGVTISANLAGSVTSVTGAVGSVTGDVGGNVVGSVASVTGAVGSVAGNVGGNVTGSVGSLAAQAKADVNAEVDSALDTAVPSSPTANSINERIKTMDDADIPGRLPATLASGRMRADTEALNGTAASAVNLERSASVIVRAAAVTGTLSTTQMTTDLTEATDDHYIGRVITWTSGVLLGQSTVVTDYTGATKLLVFTAVTEAPSNGDAFVLT